MTRPKTLEPFHDVQKTLIDFLEAVRGGDTGRLRAFLQLRLIQEVTGVPVLSCLVLGFGLWTSQRDMTSLAKEFKITPRQAKKYRDMGLLIIGVFGESDFSRPTKNASHALRKSAEQALGMKLEDMTAALLPEHEWTPQGLISQMSSPEFMKVVDATRTKITAESLAKKNAVSAAPVPPEASGKKSLKLNGQLFIVYDRARKLSLKYANEEFLVSEILETFPEEERNYLRNYIARLTKLDAFLRRREPGYGKSRAYRINPDITIVQGKAPRKKRKRFAAAEQEGPKRRAVEIPMPVTDEILLEQVALSLAEKDEELFTKFLELLQRHYKDVAKAILARLLRSKNQ